MVANDGGGRHLAELVFLDRGPLALRALVVLVAAVACGVTGYLLFRLHEDLAARLASGASLNALQTLLANGSNAKTLWPGWLAALCFTLAVARLRRGPLEPAPGRGDPERRSIAQLRRGLRGEYRVLRIVLVVVMLIAAVDSARALAFAAGAGRAGGSAFTAWAVYVEAGGFVVATAVLATYAWQFGTDIGRLGAI